MKPSAPASSARRRSSSVRPVVRMMIFVVFEQPAQARQRVHPSEPRHVEVEQQHVRPGAGCALDRLVAVGRLADHVVVLLQHDACQRAIAVVVVTEEHAHPGGQSSPSQGRMATARVQPADPPWMFTGKQATSKPVSGSDSRLWSFSMWQ